MYINNYRYLEKPPTFLYAAQKFSERLAGDPEGRTFKSDNSSKLVRSKQNISWHEVNNQILLLLLNSELYLGRVAKLESPTNSQI